ncbi:MAG: CPXCG motif-containing cysteine-rich protein [Gammaproteobacteria bacterium]|nr:CPXCG motif-containing cysteine-rich protein [Gammaproteobacteria bacterium]
MFLESTTTSCPYCGELIEFLLEPLDSDQQYYEDCTVCCQPILIKLTMDPEGGNPLFQCFRADESC